MRIGRIAGAAMFGIAAIGLSGCATGLSTQVSRYQALPAPAGQTFYVVPVNGPAGLQFGQYATQVAQQLQAQGYRPAGAPLLELVDLDRLYLQVYVPEVQIGKVRLNLPARRTFAQPDNRSSAR